MKWLSSPPMLCPSRTMRSKAGSRPSGLNVILAWLSASRRLAAAIGIGTPVGYM